jgi:cytidyltransferase-like protein|tara:strand:- start:394 stop:1182 length:789 start_codon:yes stop_codon:yes gene_type:complete
MKIVLATGGFDPMHSGHISYLKNARALGDKLIVGLNSDAWLERKKGRSFMPFAERKSIVENLKMVDKVIDFNDDDGTATQAIFAALSDIDSGKDKVIFVNGGDRTAGNSPEEKVYSGSSPVSFVYSVGGDDKMNSSSWILKDWRAPKVERSWGHYRELYQGTGFAVKELVIAPHGKLSMQRHEHRSETWNLVSGDAKLLTNWRSDNPHEGALLSNLHPSVPFNIDAGTWHQGFNDSDSPAHIVEIWKGSSDKLSEEDIERLD